MSDENSTTSIGAAISVEAEMEKRGWRFYQNALTEGDWFLFVEDGKQIGRCGDARWRNDFAAASVACAEAASK